MNKKGQVFLIATLIILSILIGLGAVYTTTKTSKEETKVYDLTNEINYEAGRVIDNGVFTGANVGVNINNLTEFYARTNPDSDFAIVYGNQTSLKEVSYIKIQTVSSSLLTSTHQSYSRDIISKPLAPIDNKIIISFKNNTYTFDLKEGQSFYLVVKKETANEEFVAAQ